MASDPPSSGTGVAVGVSSGAGAGVAGGVGLALGLAMGAATGRSLRSPPPNAVKATVAARATPAAIDARRVICVDRFGRSSTRVVISMVPSLVRHRGALSLIRRGRRFTTYERAAGPFLQLIGGRGAICRRMSTFATPNDLGIQCRGLQRNRKSQPGFCGARAPRWGDPVTVDDRTQAQAADPGVQATGLRELVDRLEQLASRR